MGGGTTTATVVVLNYNYGPFLEACLASLDAQTHPIRAIVIDDCSSDSSRDILTGWLSTTEVNVELVLKDENRGPAHSYNLALGLLKKRPSNFVSFLDSDDFLAPDKVTRQIEAFDRAPHGTVVVYSDIVELYRDGRTLVKHAHPPVEPVTQALLARGSFLAVNSGLIRGEALGRIAPFDERIRICDLHLWLQLSRQGGFHHEPVVTATVRVHDGSMSRTDNLAAARLRLIAANVSTREDRRAGRRRGRNQLNVMAASAQPSDRDAIRAYYRSTRDPMALAHLALLRLPGSATSTLRRLMRRR